MKRISCKEAGHMTPWQVAHIINLQNKIIEQMKGQIELIHDLTDINMEDYGECDE